MLPPSGQRSGGKGRKVGCPIGWGPVRQQGGEESSKDAIGAKRGTLSEGRGIRDGDGGNVGGMGPV